MSIVGKNGRVQCSTLNGLVGVDLSDRPYFKKMQETRGFVLSDYLFGRASKEPTIVAAYPVAAVDQDEDAFIIATVNLDWMSLMMGNLGGRPGVSAVLVDSAGTVLAAPPDQASMIGRSLDSSAAAVGRRRPGACFGQDQRIGLVHRRRRHPTRGLVRAHSRHRFPPDRHHR